MARYRSDIPYGYEDVSRAGYWTPDTPLFLDKREERREASRDSARRYEQARAQMRGDTRNSAAGRGGGSQRASIIDFERIGSNRSSAGAGAGGSRAAHAPTRRRDPVARAVPSPPTRSQAQYHPSRPRAVATRPEDPPRDAGVRGRFRQAQRERRHERADRAFARDYGDAPAPAPDAPRAALYNTRMGPAHHRAARMQEQAESGGFAMPAFLARAASALSLDRISAHPWFARVAVTLACVVLVMLALYQPARDYYVQTRENDQLAAEYQAVVARNADLQDQVQVLQTDEGMEQLAHDSLGWVLEGENSVSVVTDGESEATAESQAVTDAIAEGSVPAPETWYSPVLDVVFGYGG